MPQKDESFPETRDVKLASVSNAGHGSKSLPQNKEARSASRSKISGSKSPATHHEPLKEMTREAA